MEEINPGRIQAIFSNLTKQEMEMLNKINISRGNEMKPNKDLNVSATTKALDQIQVEKEMKNLKCNRPGKISNKLKKRKMNEKLAKILIPKNALILLHEIKPGCSYITKDASSQGNVGYTGFTVQVKHGKDILGIGQGLSKSQAKNLAAENAIRTLFLKAVKSVSEERQTQEVEESSEIIPWAGLAQFAMYKMFSEWQLQGPDLPSNHIQKFFNFAKGIKPVATAPQIKKELPPDAQNLHPTAVVNNLHPGLPCIELERTLGPPSRVKMAFELDGQQYCGVATNKKEAKKEAAKALLTKLYGVKYES